MFPKEQVFEGIKLRYLYNKFTHLPYKECHIRVFLLVPLLENLQSCVGLHDNTNDKVIYVLRC